jgi:hypothetical protein
MPCPAEIEAGSCAESVDRVPKLTSFSMSDCTPAAEMDFTAEAMAGSAVCVTCSALAGCTRPRVIPNKVAVVAQAAAAKRRVGPKVFFMPA